MGARENYVDLRCHLKPCMRTHGLDMAPSHGLKLVRHYRLRNSRKWYDGSQGKLRRSQIPSQTLRTNGLDMAPIKCFSGSGLPLEILLRTTGSPKPVAPTQQQVRVVLLIMRAVLMRASDFGLQALHELFASL